MPVRLTDPSAPDDLSNIADVNLTDLQEKEKKLLLQKRVLELQAEIYRLHIEVKKLYLDASLA